MIIVALIESTIELEIVVSTLLVFLALHFWAVKMLYRIR